MILPWAQLPPQFPRDALSVMKAVFDLLGKELDPWETMKVIRELPAPLRALWPDLTRPSTHNSSRGTEQKKMPIDATEFGSITVDGKTYEHDVIIRLSGKVEKRRKRLSKEKYGTSHIISKAEAKFVFEDTCDLLIVGPARTGTCDCLLRPANISTRNTAGPSRNRRLRPFRPSTYLGTEKSLSCT
jgi:hypothetical protein